MSAIALPLQPHTRWQRTPKAAVELKAAQRSLSLRERACLLFANGRRTTRDLAEAIQDPDLDLVERLVAQGYLEQVTAVGASLTVGTPVEQVAEATRGHGARVDTRQDDWRVQTVKGLIEPRSSVAMPLASGNAAALPNEAVEPVNAADEFAGRRSLATVRMFLLDLNQRMFTKRDPAVSARFLHGLRNATDREAMLAVSRDMLAEIEVAAGAERADSIAERLAAILPVAD